MRAYRVFQIENGTVIDHIDPNTALKVIDILNLHEYDKIVTVGINLESKKLGRKDIVKIEKKALTKDDLNRIALVAPHATINIIRNNKVIEKFRVKVPDIMENLILCPNPNCITRNENIISRFRRIREDPLKVKCCYCEKSFDEFSLL